MQGRDHRRPKVRLVEKTSQGAKLKVLFLSHSAEGSTIKVGSHHLSREISRLGHDVAHICTPVSSVHLLTRREKKSTARMKLLQQRVRQEGVLHATYKTMFPISLFRQRRRFLATIKSLGFTDPDIVFIDQPLMNFGSSFKDARVIYRPTDIHPRGRLRQREKQVVANTDAIVATSTRVLDSLSPRLGTPTLVLENGVETARFTGLDLAPENRVGAVYVGALDHRIDWDAIVEIANAISPDVVTLAGPVTVAAPPMPSNVVLHGPVMYSDMPGLLGRHRVGILPFNANVLNSSRSPMKYYEYLAAGLFVVGKSTPSLQERRAPGVWLYDAIDGIREIFRANEFNKSLNLEGKDYSANYDWSRRADDLLNFAKADV